MSPVTWLLFNGPNITGAKQKLDEEKLLKLDICVYYQKLNAIKLSDLCSYKLYSQPYIVLWYTVNYKHFNSAIKPLLFLYSSKFIVACCTFH